MPKRRDIVFNPVEPETGDFAVAFYDKSHPEDGLSDVIDRLHDELRGLQHHRITACIIGAHINHAEGTNEPFRTCIDITYNGYSDLFGTDSFYYDVMHEQFEIDSDGSLVFYSMEIVDHDA